MFRVPISSRGYVNDNGVNKIILTAQLPTEERYEISEIGIYSAGANSAAGKFDSKTISAFSTEEQWQLVLGSSIYSPGASDSAFFPEIQNSVIDGNNVIINQAPAIKTSATSDIFTDTDRAARYERPRYLSNVLLLKGDTSYVYSDGTNLNISGTPAFLQITGLGTDLSRNSSSDLLKLAFSVVSVDGDSPGVPDAINIIVEFSNSDNSQYARMQIEATDLVYRFADNRYVVATKRLDELFYSTGQFSWKNVSVVKVYATAVNDLLITNKELASNVATLTTSAAHGLTAGNYVKISGVDSTFNGTYLVTDTPTTQTFTYAKTGTNVLSQIVVPNGTLEAPSDEYYVALDALRVDNVSTVNPVYGLTGYSIIQNPEKATIIKSPNTNNYIEYRFILDVT
jgi:hypothetical protein